MRIKSKMISGYVILACFVAALGAITVVQQSTLKIHVEELNAGLLGEVNANHQMLVQVQTISIHLSRLIHVAGIEKNDIVDSLELAMSELRKAFATFKEIEESNSSSDKAIIEKVNNAERVLDGYIAVVHRLINAYTSESGLKHKDYEQLHHESAMALQTLQNAMSFMQGIPFEEAKKLSEELKVMAKEDTMNTMGLTVFFFLLAIVFGYFVSSRVSRNVERLTQYAKKVGEGDFDATLSLDTKDELSSLASTIATMMTDIKQLTVSKEVLAREVEMRRRTETALFDAEMEAKTHSKSLQELLSWNKAMMDSAAQGMVVIDEKGIIEMFNRQAQSSFGYSLEEVQGQNISMLLPEPHRTNHDGYLQHYYQTGEQKVIGKMRVLDGCRKDGSPLPIELHVSEVMFEGKRKFLGIFRDMTELDRAQHEIIDAWKRNKAMLDGAADGMIMIDDYGEIEVFNKAAEEMFGYEAYDVIGENISMLMPEKQAAEHPEKLKAFRETGIGKIINTSVEVDAKHSSGQVFPIELKVNEVQFEGGRRFFGIVRDMTERRKLESDLRMAQKMEAVGVLAAGVAHEINTPLQYVGNNLQFLNESIVNIEEMSKNYRLLKSSCTDQQLLTKLHESELDFDLDFILEELPGAIAQSVEGIDKASHIVAAMKEFSHPGQQEKSLADINHMLDSAITVARNEWKYVAELETHFLPDLPMIQCHSELNQVFLNMIVNAAHAIEEKLGKESVEKGLITVATSVEQGMIKIEIQDTGIGMPESVKHKVFDPFFTTKEVGKGTGQGLSIAHTIVVDRHHGALEIESEVGKGTTFIVRIPMKSGDRDE